MPSPIFVAFRIIAVMICDGETENSSLLFPRRQDSSIGFGAPVRANMRVGGLTNAVVTSSLLESVRIKLYLARDF